jgi:hypothetical protein
MTNPVDNRVLRILHLCVRARKPRRIGFEQGKRMKFEGRSWALALVQSPQPVEAHGSLQLYWLVAATFTFNSSPSTEGLLR